MAQKGHHLPSVVTIQCSESTKQLIATAATAHGFGAMMAQKGHHLRSVVTIQCSESTRQLIATGVREKPPKNFPSPTVHRSPGQETAHPVRELFTSKRIVGKQRNLNTILLVAKVTILHLQL